LITTSQIKTLLEDALVRNEKLKQKNYVSVIKVWVAQSGLIEHIELVSSTGTAEIDGAIQQSIRGTEKLSEAPPDAMPQPVKLRLTSR
jgi:outer membrane biosynthesis protein TonB